MKSMQDFIETILGQRILDHLSANNGGHGYARITGSDNIGYSVPQQHIDERRSAHFVNLV